MWRIHQPMCSIHSLLWNLEIHQKRSEVSRGGGGGSPPDPSRITPPSPLPLSAPCPLYCTRFHPVSVNNLSLSSCKREALRPRARSTKGPFMPLGEQRPSHLGWWGLGVRLGLGSCVPTVSSKHPGVVPREMNLGFCFVSMLMCCEVPVS